MTVLTTIAVFTIGLVSGIFSAWSVLTWAMKRYALDGHITLTALHKCPDGHIHATLKGGAIGELAIVLKDGMPSQTGTL